MKHMISPTGKDVRMDGAGSGRFGAPRGGRTHDGVDWLADPGDPVKSPIRGKVTRIVYPYADDLSFKGVEIVNDGVIVHLLYVEPLKMFIGREVGMGSVVGHAQDVRKRYPNDKDMKNHVHHRCYINPVIFM
jgi:murein DD-endopeptidase MepM/ murein hydrolase activator NlpD